MEHKIPKEPKQTEASRVKLGEAFLNASNHWLRNPDGNPEEKLSAEGKMYLGDIKRVLNAVRNELIRSKGAVFHDPIIFGKTLDEYLEFVKENVDFAEEYYYIEGVSRAMMKLLTTIRNELSAQPRTLLERLEERQNNRGQAFNPTLKED